MKSMALSSDIGLYFFFFQAEDGIRDVAVTGVQTCALPISLVLAFLCGPAIIRRLRERNVGQVIRAEGPASHHAKRGTPTMGGLIIILATVVPTLLWARLDSRYVVVAVYSTL